MLAEQVCVDPPRLTLPGRVLVHREDDAEVVVPAVERLQLLEERRRLAVAVRVHERDPVVEPVLGDRVEHAAEDGDPDPARDEGERPARVLRQDVAALRLLDVRLRPDLELRHRALERRVADPCREPEHAALVRRGDDGEVPARPLLVVVRRVDQVDEEVLPRLEVDLGALEVEDDHPRALRDLGVLLDGSAHAGGKYLPKRDPYAGRRRGGNERRAADV